MTQTGKPLAVFTLTNPWVQEVILEVAPDSMDVAFVDIKQEEEAKAILSKATFINTVKIPFEWTPLLTNCKHIQHNGVGYADLDVEGFKEMGISLGVSPAYTAVGVGEHVILMILALSRNLIPLNDDMHKGHFNMFGRRKTTYTFHGKTLGIVGLGRIGKEVARLAKAFGVTILYNDIVAAPETLEKELDVTRVSFDDLLAQSDIVTIHTPLTELTNNIFNADAFAKMKPDSLFINASRGKTYDIDALYESLKSGHIRGTALDVFDPEPLNFEHPIMELENVILTPHLASGTVERHYAIAKQQFDNFEAVLNATPLENQVL